MPITWRNVKSRSNATGAALLEGARESITGANETFQRVFDRRRETQEANRDNTIDNNTAAFRDYVNSFDSPEALAAAEADGRIDARRAEAGPLIDQDATRGLARDRITGLREQQLVDNKYADTTRERGNREARNAVATDIANKDYDSARDRVANNDFLNSGKISQNIAAEEQAAQDRKQKLADADRRRRRSILENERTDEEFAREEAERVRREEADDLVTATARSREERAQRNANVRRSIADDMGVGYNNGKLNTDAMSPEQASEYIRRLEEQGVDSVTGVSGSKLDFTQKLRNSGLDLNNAEIAEYSGVLADTVAGDITLEPKDEEFLKGRFATLESDATEAQEQIDAEHEKIVQGNSYAQVRRDPNEEAAELLQFMDSPEFDPTSFSDNQVRKEVGEAVTQAVTNGIDIPSGNSPSQERSKTGPGPAAGNNSAVSDRLDGREVIPITPAMAKIALTVVKDRGGDMAQEFNEVLRDMTKEAGFKERMNEGLAAAERHREKSETLRKRLDQSKLKTEARVLMNNGLRVETGNEVDAALRRRANQ